MQYPSPRMINILCMLLWYSEFRWNWYKVGKLIDGFLQYFDCFHSYQYCPHSTNLLSHFKHKIFLTKEIREMQDFPKQFKCLPTGKLPNDEIHFGSSNFDIPTSPTFQGTFHALLRSISKLGRNFIFGFSAKKVIV